MGPVDAAEPMVCRSRIYEASGPASEWPLFLPASPYYTRTGRRVKWTAPDDLTH